MSGETAGDAVGKQPFRHDIVPVECMRYAACTEYFVHRFGPAPERGIQGRRAGSCIPVLGGETGFAARFSSVAGAGVSRVFPGTATGNRQPKQRPMGSSARRSGMACDGLPWPALACWDSDLITLVGRQKADQIIFFADPGRLALPTSEGSSSCSGGAACGAAAHRQSTIYLGFTQF